MTVPSDKYDVFIHPYSSKSASANALKDRMNERGIRTAFCRTDGRSNVSGRSIINWGSSRMDAGLVSRNQVFNPPDVIELMVDKTKFYSSVLPGLCPQVIRHVHGIRPHLKYVLRTNPRGSRGEGTQCLSGEELIALIQSNSIVWENVLVTLYKNKRREFRVHVMNGEVLFIQEKRRRFSVPVEDVDWQIRTADDFAFCSADGILSERWAMLSFRNHMKNVASALHDHGVDFGGVDVGYHDHFDSTIVYEVNAAPGIEGTDIDRYIDGFIQNYRAPYL